MKLFLILITILFNGFSFGKELLSDSIYLKSGETISVKVISKQRKTITNRVCLNSDTRTEKINRKKIISIFFASNEDSKNVINRRDSTPYLLLSRINSKSHKVKRINENKRLIINTFDSLTIQGKLLVLSKDSILLISKLDSAVPVSISDIRIIKKPSKASKIVGNTFGGLFAFIGSAVLIDLGFEDGAPFTAIADGISLPFFAMNYIRKRYNLETKWKAEVKFQLIE